MTKRLLLCFLPLMMMACSSCEKPPQAPKSLTTYPTNKALREPSDFHKGIGLGLYYEHKPRTYDVMFDEIKETGTDHVELVLHWTQKDVRATELKPHPVDTIKD